MNLILGDCIEKMQEMDENSVDSIVCDPPYELGFMGKKWDNTGIAYNIDVWEQALRVLKPGGFLLAFGGTRTCHRLTCAIEDAGFEIRDMIMWTYGSGFPKSLNIGKAAKKEYENRISKRSSGEQKTKHRVRSMSGTDLQSPLEIKNTEGEILQSGLQEQSLQTYRQEGYESEISNGEQPSLEGRDNIQKTEGELQGCPICEMSDGIPSNGKEGQIYNGTQISDGSTPETIINEGRSSSSYRPQSKQQPYIELDALCEQHRTQEIRRLEGFGTALKPALEPITVARKPLSEKTVAANVRKWGAGGINIDGCRIGDVVDSRRPVSQKPNNTFKTWSKTSGAISARFPANLIHDGSDEVEAGFPQTKSVGGSASRFFYCAKSSKCDRDEGLNGFDESKTNDGRNKEIDNAFQRGSTLRHNNHPTVKPTKLMQYLVRLVTPKGGTVLDPFAGSGSTGKACKLEGFIFIGIEKEKEYFEIA